MNSFSIGTSKTEPMGVVAAVSGSGAQITVREAVIFAVRPLHITDIKVGDTVCLAEVGTGTWRITAVLPRPLPATS